MVARPAPVRARKVRRHPPLEVARGPKGMWIDETEPRANRRSLVQVDAHSASVALSRPVRVSDVRAAASRVLGTTPAGRAVRDGNVLRNARAKCETRAQNAFGNSTFGNNNVVDPMFGNTGQGHSMDSKDILCQFSEEREHARCLRDPSWYGQASQDQAGICARGSPASRGTAWCGTEGQETGG